MKNALQVFENAEFGKVRTIEEEGRVLFCGSDVAKALGYKEPHKAVSRHCRDGGMKRPVIDSLGRNQEAVFITEGDIYRLAAKSELPGADKFESWIFDEVLPSIRKHGMYATPVTIESMIANPDFAIKLLNELKEEQEKRKLLEAEVKEKTDEILYQGNVISGLVENIDLAEKRQRISQIIRHKVKDPKIIARRWNTLYKEFDKKYHMNLDLRFKNYIDKNGSKTCKNKIDFIDKQLNMISQLYEVACKFFESDVEELMKEWKSILV